jgi:hypothetical protein
MSYSNSFKLSIKKNEQLVAKIHCVECDLIIDSKFCPKCGEEGKIKEIPIVEEELISAFRKSEEGDEYCHLIDDFGETEEQQSGYDFEIAIAKFSPTYPKVVFQLDVDWDDNESSPSRYYIKDGKIQNCKVEIVFEELKL